MKVYRLVHKDYKGEVVFGLPFPYNNSDGEQKINLLFSKMKPWKHCIPYYKDSKFAFVSLDAINSFLFYNKSELTEQEFNDINDNFFVESYDVGTWSNGLSDFLCTYFDNEIIDTYETFSLKDLVKLTFNLIKQSPVPQKNIKMAKESYYSKVKTYYKN